MTATNIKRYSCYGIIAISFLWLASTSWLRWGDLLIDTFRDPWVAYKLTQGKVLYRDFFYAYGFLPPYFLAFIFTIFGVHMTPCVYVGIAVTLIVAFLAYRISRLFLSRAFATLLAVNFLFVFAFNASAEVAIMNFILPYSIASTFFIMFALGSLYCYSKLILKEKPAYGSWWALFLYCAFLSRPDHSIMLWIAYSVIGMPLFVSQKKARAALYLLAPPAAAAVSYFVFLQTQSAAAGFGESVFGFLRFSGSGKSYFSLALAGLTNIPKNTVVAIVSFFVQVSALTFFYGLSLVLALLCNRYPGRQTALVSYAVAFACAALGGLFLARFLVFDQYTPCLIMFILAIGSFSYALALHRNAHRKKYLSLLALLGVATALLFRIVLNSTPHNQGFFLLVPGLIAYYLFCIEWYPQFMARFVPAQKGLARYYRLCVGVMLILLAVPFAKESHYWFCARNYSLAIDGRMKMYYTRSPRTELLHEALGYIANNTAGEDTIVAFPEGIGINFLAKRDNPLFYVEYHLLYEQEAKTINALENSAIDYIVIVSRPSPEHGRAQFGRDYGSAIASWIEERYRLEKVFGAHPLRSPDFGIAFYKRK